MGGDYLVRGGLGLAFDTVEGVTNIVEGMHRNIAVPPFFVTPQGRAPGIAGFVYACIRGVNSVVRSGSRHAFELSALGGDGSDVVREFAHEPSLSVLNGVLGDHLERTSNPLAISMSLCVDGHPLCLEPQVLRTALPDVSGHVLILVHGLCMNDVQWTRVGKDGTSHNHGSVLAAALGCTPLWLRYNSGRHISTNGRDLAELLTRLDQRWPVALKRITFVGHSMGGLVIRSGLHAAAEQGAAWLPKVDRAAYVGAPHHGAALERAGNRFQGVAGWSRYTEPLSRLGAIRSAGITDLRYGNVVDADWNGDERFERHDDCRHATPLTEGPEHFAIAGTLSTKRRVQAGMLLGDGLVHPTSATGHHRDAMHALGFAPDHTSVVSSTGHLQLLSSATVCAQLKNWLCA